MDTDEYTERVARVRRRFAAALPGKIDESIKAMADCSGASDLAVETVIATHRSLHNMCGIAPTIGFEATAKAARDAELVLRAPAKAQRALTRAEIAALESQLDSLRTAARCDLRSIMSQG